MQFGYPWTLLRIMCNQLVDILSNIESSRNPLNIFWHRVNLSSTLSIPSCHKPTLCHMLNVWIDSSRFPHNNRIFYTITLNKINGKHPSTWKVLSITNDILSNFLCSLLHSFYISDWTKKYLEWSEIEIYSKNHLAGGWWWEISKTHQ